MGRLPVAELASLIRDIPDVPQPGIVFKDITPLLAHPDGLASAIEALADPWRDAGIDTVVGIEARGFILGAAAARSLGVGFVPIRKAGKLPGATMAQQYDLEYGTDTIEIHSDAVSPGEHVLVLDDVLATGGTAAAAALLLERLGATLAGYSFLLELSFLDGRAKLGDARIEAAIEVGC
ncbi:MAG: adenine phosphoribosyltransferase [Acidimicrobiaceae bacterium]|jgi:adenine phosphoribosyltransferase|nr:adenine phosphoribosyltransferase [Acidimicrobiaceae bacterium]HAB57803.1 adenine phosphoribosyltransferase [Acidimicrobiaceae bacterium]